MVKKKKKKVKESKCVAVDMKRVVKMSVALLEERLSKEIQENLEPYMDALDLVINRFGGLNLVRMPLPDDILTGHPTLGDLLKVIRKEIKTKYTKDLTKKRTQEFEEKIAAMLTSPESTITMDR